MQSLTLDLRLIVVHVTQPLKGCSLSCNVLDNLVERYYHWTCVSPLEREYIINGSLNKDKWCCLIPECIADLALRASDDYYCAESFSRRFMKNYYDQHVAVYESI